MREFFESIFAYVTGPTVAALVIGVLGKSIFDHWLVNRQNAREQKLTEESETRSRNIERRNIAIDDIRTRLRDWKKQYENINALDQLPLESLEKMQAGTYASIAPGLSFAARNVWSIIELYDTTFAKKDYEQLTRFAQEIATISKTFEDSLENYIDGRSMGDQPDFLSSSRNATWQLIQNVNRTALQMHDALIERFRELSGSNKS
jgi:hypothetical protein